MPSEHPTDAPAAARKRDAQLGRVLGLPAPLFWPALIVAILSVGVGFGLVTAYLAANDPTFGVEPNYYEKALRWDEHRAQLAKNDELGWRVRILVDQPESVQAERPVRLLVTDAAGAPIEGASAHVEAFHLARSSQRLHADLPQVAPGQHRAILPVTREGRWEFRYEIRRGDEVFADVQSVYVAAGARDGGAS